MSYILYVFLDMHVPLPVFHAISFIIKTPSCISVSLGVSLYTVYFVLITEVVTSCNNLIWCYLWETNDPAFIQRLLLEVTSLENGQKGKIISASTIIVLSCVWRCGLQKAPTTARHLVHKALWIQLTLTHLTPASSELCGPGGGSQLVSRLHSNWFRQTRTKCNAPAVLASASDFEVILMYKKNPLCRYIYIYKTKLWRKLRALQWVTFVQRTINEGHRLDFYKFRRFIVGELNSKALIWNCKDRCDVFARIIHLSLPLLREHVIHLIRFFKTKN